MVNLDKYIGSKEAFIFAFDDVLYPEKDYLLQVYYLFAEFMEYTEQLDAKKITAFMQSSYVNHGSVNIFEETASAFNLPQKYFHNFILLHENARLPLKLLLFKNILSFLQAIVVERKPIFLWITGNPQVQLNKIRQMEWHGLEEYLKVYFAEEISLKRMLDEHGVSAQEAIFVGDDTEDQETAVKLGIEFLASKNLN